MSDIGIKISKPGYDIKSTGKENQVMNSEANSLKIWMSGNVNISKLAGTGDFTVNVAHGLGYAPFFLVYFKLVHATKLWMQDSLDASILPVDFVSGLAKSDSTNLILTIRDNSGVASFTGIAYYHILIDKAYE